MISHLSNGVHYYSFENLDKAGVVSAAFTRTGGVSSVPWATLNVGGTVGDDPERVAENRRRAFSAVNRPLSSMFDVWQVHSSDVVVTDRPRPANEAHQKADIILTRSPDVTLFMRFADCVPILLFDPIHKAIGLAHSGWLGTVNQVGRSAIAAMQSQFGTNPADLIACIGPSICADHYPVGSDVADKAGQAFEQKIDQVLIERGGQTHFDLWKANQIVLEESGVTNIEIAGICTACHSDEWFSHRGERGKTGRFGVLFGMK